MQFKYPVGVILNICGEWSLFGGFLEGEVWTDETVTGGGLGWNFHANIPHSLDMWMPGAEVKL